MGLGRPEVWCQPCQALPRCLQAVVMLMPGAGCPINLSQLLRMPPQERLQMQISSPASASRSRAVAPWRLPMSTASSVT